MKKFGKFAYAERITDVKDYLIYYYRSAGEEGKYEGATWSSLTEEEQMDVIRQMKLDAKPLYHGYVAFMSDLIRVSKHTKLRLMAL